MKVYINCDEWYPVYEMRIAEHFPKRENQNALEASPEFVERWKKCMLEFMAVQKELKRLCEQERSNP